MMVGVLMLMTRNRRAICDAHEPSKWLPRDLGRSFGAGCTRRGIERRLLDGAGGGWGRLLQTACVQGTAVVEMGP